MLDRMFGGSFETLQRGLDGNAARLRAIGANIANADTPGYKRRGVSFEHMMQGEEDFSLSVTQPGHLSVGPLSASMERPLEWTDTSSTLRNDGNNVDIDREVTQLAETHATYNALSELVKRRMDSLKTVLRESR